MGFISLEGLQFFAHHGYYEEERTIGNRYELDIILEVDFLKAAKTDDLQETVNYEEVYAIVKEEMQIPSKLLENIIYRIFKKVGDRFPQVLSAKGSISKFNPPIGGVCERAKITIEKHFHS